MVRALIQTLMIAVQQTCNMRSYNRANSIKFGIIVPKKPHAFLRLAAAQKQQVPAPDTHALASVCWCLLAPCWCLLAP